MISLSYRNAPRTRPVQSSIDFLARNRAPCHSRPQKACGVPPIHHDAIGGASKKKPSRDGRVDFPVEDASHVSLFRSWCRNAGRRFQQTQRQEKRKLRARGDLDKSFRKS